MRVFWQTPHFSLNAGCGVLRHPIDNEVWERLPASIVAARCRSHRKQLLLKDASLEAPEGVFAIGFSGSADVFPTVNR
jgi:hypothetical protein